MGSMKRFLQRLLAIWRSFMADTIEVDLRKKRVWIGNGTASFVISVMVMNLFAGYIIILAVAPGIVAALSPEQRGAVLGVLIAQFTSSVQYWLGSSIGSQNKDIQLAEARKNGQGEPKA